MNERIKTALETKERCRATHIQSLRVREKWGGEVVWDGVVETFDLHDHPTAKRVCGWERWDGNEPHYTVELASLR